MCPPKSLTEDTQVHRPYNTIYSGQMTPTLLHVSENENENCQKAKQSGDCLKGTIESGWVVLLLVWGVMWMVGGGWAIQSPYNYCV